MFRKVPMYTVSNLGEVEELAAAVRDPIVIIFDADNTLVPQGVPIDEFKQGVNSAITRFEAQPFVQRVIILSNGPRRGVSRMTDRGNKPWTSRRRLGLESTRSSVWVVGDQILTDGVLAWRLGATYVLLAIDEFDEAPRQALMRRLGRAVKSLLFTLDEDDRHR